MRCDDWRLDLFACTYGVSVLVGIVMLHAGNSFALSDRDHSSRLNDPRSAVYYLLTLILQLIPYSLAVGAGVNAGVALFRPAPYINPGNGSVSSRKRCCGTWAGFMR